MKKHLIYIAGLFFITACGAEIIISQPDKLPGNVSGYNGNAVQINLQFKDYKNLINDIKFKVDDTEIFTITNNTGSNILRFGTRIRMKANEVLKVSTISNNNINEIEFRPTIEKDFTNPIKDEFNPKPRTTKAESNSLKQFYGTEKDDCAFLLLGVSNSSIIPKSYEIYHQNGSITVSGSNRFSSNPLFSIGLNTPADKCEVKIFQ